MHFVLLKIHNKERRRIKVNTIASQMSAHGMKMDCIVVRGQQNVDKNKRVMEENDLLLGIFSKKTSSKMVYVESSTSLLGACRTRNISPVTIYRGDLEISSSLKIKVRTACQVVFSFFFLLVARKCKETSILFHF